MTREEFVKDYDQYFNDYNDEYIHALYTKEIYDDIKEYLYETGLPFESYDKWSYGTVVLPYVISCESSDCDDLISYIKWYLFHKNSLDEAKRRKIVEEYRGNMYDEFAKLDAMIFNIINRRDAWVREDHRKLPAEYYLTDDIKNKIFELVDNVYSFNDYFDDANTYNMITSDKHYVTVDYYDNVYVTDDGRELAKSLLG